MMGITLTAGPFGNACWPRQSRGPLNWGTPCFFEHYPSSLEQSQLTTLRTPSTGESYTCYWKCASWVFELLRYWDGAHLRVFSTL